MNSVFFHYADKKLNIPGKRKIKTAVEKIFKSEKEILHRLDYIFCSDEYLLEINQKRLNHDFYTDVITFGLSLEKNIIGEIYISLDRVKENAETMNLPFFDECLRVIFHGALHLCRYKDKTEKEIKIMREKEDFYIQRFKNSR